MSKIVDWNGRVLAEAGPGESLNANAILDLPALRAARNRTGMSNLLTRLPLAAFAPGYEAGVSQEPNAMADGRMLTQGEAIERQRGRIAALRDAGVFTGDVG